MRENKDKKDRKDPDWMNGNLDTTFQLSANNAPSKAISSHEKESINEQTPLVIRTIETNTKSNLTTAKYNNENNDDSKPFLDEHTNENNEHDFQKKEQTIRPTCCHSFFILISTYSSIALIFLFASQLAPPFLYQITGLHLYLRIYIAFFSFILLLVETGVPYFSRRSVTRSAGNGNDNNRSSSGGFMENWISRGILHSFLGLVNQEESSVMTKDHKEDLTEGQILLDVFVYVTTWMMVLSGILYALMGVLCLKGVKDNCQMNYRKAMEKEKQRKAILKEEGILV